nr:hypothetical protein [Coxiella burnetii]
MKWGDRGQKAEDRRQWLCRYATTKFYKLIVAKPHNHCPLSSVLCPLSSVLCPLSSVFCLLSSVFCRTGYVIISF